MQHLVVSLLLVLAAPSVDQAEAAFAAEEFDRAAEIYAELYAESGDPAHLYGGAQALRRAERWADAAALYDRFVLHAEPLLAGVEGSTRAALQQMIDNARAQADACRAELPAQEQQQDEEQQAEPELQVESEPEPEPEPEPPPPQPLPRLDDPGPQKSDRPRWSRDPAAITLVAVGSAVLLTGVSMLIAASVLDARAEGDAADHDDFLARIDRATTIQRIAPAPTAVGAALIIGGGVRFAVARKRSRLHATASGIAVRF